jgi:hypothetical protein
MPQSESVCRWHIVPSKILKIFAGAFFARQGVRKANTFGGI